ncbi:MAG: hypothetical protein S4CHLAM102_01280 [Chlamydiia bacterium]|nr:hypothetical protein [Chlamydiia bacterium]
MARVVENFLKKALWLLPLLCGAFVGAEGILSQNLIEMINQEQVSSKGVDFASWKQKKGLKGGCYSVFPTEPQHLNQRIAMGDGGKELIYDVYIADLDRKEVFMVLVAEYPKKVDEKYELMTLENLLNSILNQSSSNRLVSADIIEIQGRKAIEFAIESNNVSFKGRAVMNDQFLHLVAMECDTRNFRQEHYQYFIEQFGFVKTKR